MTVLQSKNQTVGGFIKHSHEEDLCLLSALCQQHRSEHILLYFKGTFCWCACD